MVLFYLFPYGKFCIILNDLANDQYGDSGNSKLSLERAIEYYRKLSERFQNLSNVLKPNNIALTSHLELQ